MHLGQDRRAHGDKAGLDWSMPIGQDRPGLVNAHGAGQASTRICPWERQVWTC